MVKTRDTILLIGLGLAGLFFFSKVKLGNGGGGGSLAEEVGRGVGQGAWDAGTGFLKGAVQAPAEALAKTAYNIIYGPANEEVQEYIQKKQQEQMEAFESIGVDVSGGPNLQASIGRFTHESGFPDGVEFDPNRQASIGKYSSPFNAVLDRDLGATIGTSKSAISKKTVTQPSSPLSITGATIGKYSSPMTPVSSTPKRRRRTETILISREPVATIEGFSPAYANVGYEGGRVGYVPPPSWLR